MQDQIYIPDYIAKMWAHHRTTLEGPSIVRNIVHRVGNCTETNPNQTPSRPELRHNCASQQHPDTMHNKRFTNAENAN